MYRTDTTANVSLAPWTCHSRQLSLSGTVTPGAQIP